MSVGSLLMYEMFQEYKFNFFITMIILLLFIYVTTYNIKALILEIDTIINDVIIKFIINEIE